MHRRDLLKLGLAVLPATIPAAWAQQAAKPDWRPAVLDEHQNETVIVLTELIIPATDTPGAKAARVNRYIDLFLRDGDARQRERLIAGLNWLDGHALREHSHPFVRLTPAQQTAMLTAISQGGSSLPAGREFFRSMKSLTSGIYYNTQIGYQELNKGGRVPKTFGCTHGTHA
jgi:hypothetical protein